MKNMISFFFVCLLGQASYGRPRFLECDFRGLKRNAAVVSFGMTKKSFDAKYDFDLEIPKSDQKDWHQFLGTLKVLGSVQTPEKGWLGLALVSNQKLNEGWACVQLIKGQTLVLTKTSGELTVHARCSVK